MRKVMLLMACLGFVLAVGVFAGGADEAATTTTEESSTASGEAMMPQGQFNLEDYEKMTGKSITSFSQAPFFDGKGLPPVKDRLPDSPVVMIPWMDSGSYGGTLAYTGYTIDYGTYLRHLNEVRLLELAPSNANHVYNFVGGEIQPGVFDFWEKNANATQFTFRIRKGIKWSDGVPVTTEDVLFTFEDVYFNEEITPTLPSWVRWGDERVVLDIVDDYTFKLTFAKSYGLLIEQVAGWTCAQLIKPKHYLSKHHTKYTPIADLESEIKDAGYTAEEWGKYFTSLDIGAAGYYVPTRHSNALEYPHLRCSQF